MQPASRHAAVLVGASLLLGCRTAAEPAEAVASPSAAAAPTTADREEPAAVECADAAGCAADTAGAEVAAAPPEPEPTCDGGERCDAEAACPSAEACFEGCCLPLAVERCTLVLPKKIAWQTPSKWEVDQASVATLDVIAATLLRLGSPRAQVEVHTDSKGSSKYGMKPTQKRADTVRRELVERGVDPRSLVALGYGEDVPIATNKTEEGRAKNRRVDVVLLDCRERAAAAGP